ncbi:hypothetical protein EBU95_03890 [bacterium]|nr:hypothetical protein [bacterium]
MVYINIYIALLTVALTSCSHQKSIWPAKIVGFKNFTYEEINEINNYIKDLNTKSLSVENGKEIINSKVNDENYKILIKFIDEDTKTSSRVAGTALRLAHKCIISIYPVCFEKQLLKTVLWHELGHCAKLNHNETQSSIMYKTAKPFVHYTEENIEDFIKNLNKSLWK